MECVIDTIVFVDGDNTVELQLSSSIRMSPLVNMFEYIESTNPKLFVDIHRMPLSKTVFTNTIHRVNVKFLASHLFNQEITYTLQDVRDVVDMLTIPSTTLVGNPRMYELLHFIDAYSDCFILNKEPFILENGLKYPIDVIEKYIKFTCGHTKVLFVSNVDMYNHLLSNETLIPIQMLSIQCGSYEFPIILNVGEQGINLWNFLTTIVLYTKDECNRRARLHALMMFKDVFKYIKHLCLQEETKQCKDLFVDFETLKTNIPNLFLDKFKFGKVLNDAELNAFNSPDHYILFDTINNLYCNKLFSKNKCCSLQYDLKRRIKVKSERGLCDCYTHKDIDQNESVDIATESGSKYVQQVHELMSNYIYTAKDIGFETTMTEELFNSLNMLPILIQKHYPTTDTIPIVSSNDINIENLECYRVSLRVHLGFVFNAIA